MGSRSLSRSSRGLNQHLRTGRWLSHQRSPLPQCSYRRSVAEGVAGHLCTEPGLQSFQWSSWHCVVQGLNLLYPITSIDSPAHFKAADKQRCLYHPGPAKGLRTALWASQEPNLLCEVWAPMGSPHGYKPSLPRSSSPISTCIHLNSVLKPCCAIHALIWSSFGLRWHRTSWLGLPQLLLFSSFWI